MLKSLMRDVQLFARHASKLSLRSYQQSVAVAIVESVIEGRGDTIVVMFPRQSGKNELQAQVESYLLMLFFTANAEVVKISPTWKPQSFNAMRRLERVLSKNMFTQLNWKKESGYIYRVGDARIFFLSGSQEANIVGATASTLLEVDEAQDVTIPKFDKDIAPMAASTNATRVFWCTAWTSRTLLARELRIAREAERRDGRKRTFVLTADDVATEVPAYGKFVAEQIAKFGRNHPLVRTQYYSEEIDAESGMFSAHRLALMQGSHPRQTSPSAQPGRIYALLIDVAGEDEAVADDTAISGLQLHSGPGLPPGKPTPAKTGPVDRPVEPGRGGAGWRLRSLPRPSGRGAHACRAAQGSGLANPSRDSTALTVVEIDLDSLANEAFKAPTYRVVDRKSWVGVRHSTLHAHIRALVEHWATYRVVIDATGVGAGLASFLERAFPNRVIPFVFNSTTKSRLGWDFMAIIETGRFKDYATEESQRAAFNLQLSYCQMEIIPGPDRKMRWGVPDSARDVSTGEVIHDDWIMSAALCAVLDGLEWSISAPPLLVQAADPLQQMDREGF